MRPRVVPAAHLLRTILVLAASAVMAGMLAGVLSRGVMRVASLIDAAPGVKGFTWDGSLRLIRDVVLLYSAPATLLFAVARRLLPGSWLLKGILFGGLLFLVFLVAQLGPEKLLVKFLFGLVPSSMESRWRSWSQRWRHERDAGFGCPSSDRMACQAGRCSRRSPPRRRPSVDGMDDDGLVVGRQLRRSH